MTMNKLKFLPLEATIYEGLKAGKPIQQIREETGEKRDRIYCRVRRLMEIGALKQSGKRKSYVYTPVEVSYEVISPRRSPDEDKQVPIEDRLLDNLHVFELSEDQKWIMNENQHLGRTALAAKLGITKLQLNYVLYKASKRSRLTLQQRS